MEWSSILLLLGFVGCMLPAQGELDAHPLSLRRRLPYNHDENTVVFPLERRRVPWRMRRLSANYTRRRLSSYISGVMTIGGHKIATQEEGTDYYFATLMLGTPPKPFDLIIDTGSTLAYLPCEHTCTHCGRHTHPPLTKKSTSYKELDCHSKYCSSGVTRLSCSSKTCSYSKSYLEGSSVSGLLVTDALTLKGPDGVDTPAPIVFGCTTRETNLIYSQDADGVMGIGREPIAIPSQLVDNGVIDDVFSMCMAERRNGREDGHMVFGAGVGAGSGADDLVWVDMKKPHGGHSHITSWYIVMMDSMTVGDKKLDTPASTWSSSSYGGAVIDTGTTDMMLPRRLFDLFNNAIIDHLKNNGNNFHHYYDRIEGNMCFKGTSTTKWEGLFPDFSIKFGNGEILQLYALNYVLDVNKSTQCLSVFTNSGGVILGSNTLLNVMLVFDRKNWRMGFAPSACDGPQPYGESLTKSSGRLLAVQDDENFTFTLPTVADNDIPFMLLISIISISVIGFVVWFFGIRKRRRDADPVQLELARSERQSLVSTANV